MDEWIADSYRWIPLGGCWGFKEKQATLGARYVNAGIYMARKSIVGDVPIGLQVSLESELFPRWLDQGKHFRAYSHPGKCIDIGTPERYRSAESILAQVEKGERPPRNADPTMMKSPELTIQAETGTSSERSEVREQGKQ
jgi:NDP-sugar pyrophosphorylase family protein